MHVPATWIETVPVQRWMRQPVTTIGAETSIRDAVAVMREHEIRHLPVVDGQERLIGIVTDRDLRQAALDAVLGRVSGDVGRLGEVPVREVMTWAVIAVVPRTGLHEAARLMRERRLGALPVVDAAGHVIGILTERDLIDALQAVLRERVGGPKPAAGTPGGTYDLGLELPPDHDPWQNTAALD